MKKLVSVIKGKYKLQIQLNEFDRDDTGLNVKMIGDEIIYDISFGYISGFFEKKIKLNIEPGIYLYNKNNLFLETMKEWKKAIYDENQKQYIIVGENSFLLVLSEWKVEINKVINRRKME
ncbi:MAG: hypothetical protein K6F01_01250 [Selenomonas sp.]|uniref:hypothetical protein n=1 Tax=Selenomonas sp. TaxID=2053611 RepID=UPI0025CC5946|nr:hypothetical protein [Selenomonas sp.]MCR5438075.1 hypothetical protein [Selenomonas sp.]